ncbi:PepSY domain-containing protein [Bacillus sp. V3B]|uniref:PepSY domain-containing protein n=1 Tax=Bacillus sp. V3B TaxID=2804915 RepID=UPI002108B4B7|nr:PepSY domain-containing protein [Bacillus sp. V3B]MCQ6274472.1 PepSY domain-containing protein [Bacillus sp. V3B]
MIYQVDVREAGVKTTLFIDATTGEILKKEIVDIEESPKRLTEQDAIALALQQVPGVVEDVDVETINGVGYYFVEVETIDDREATIEINAITGEVKSLTWDDDDDDD